MAPSFFTLILDGGTSDTWSFLGVGRLGGGPHLVPRLKREQNYTYTPCVSFMTSYIVNCTFTRWTGMVNFTHSRKEPPIHIEQNVGFFGTEKILLPPTHSGYCTEYAIPAGFCVMGHTFSAANIKNIQMLGSLQFSKDRQNISSLPKGERKHYLC